MKQLMEDEKLEVVSKIIFNETMTMRSEKKANLIGINLNDDGISYNEINSYADIYDMLGSAPSHSEKFEGYDLVAVLTAGWAAPVGEDDDVAPSLHKNRRRVYLALIGNTSTQTSSIISFSDNNELIYENGSGALQEAFEEMLVGIGW